MNQQQAKAAVNAVLEAGVRDGLVRLQDVPIPPHDKDREESEGDTSTPRLALQTWGIRRKGRGPGDLDVAAFVTFNAKGEVFTSVSQANAPDEADRSRHYYPDEPSSELWTRAELEPDGDTSHDERVETLKNAVYQMLVFEPSA